jgi:hypothetical protein
LHAFGQLSWQTPSQHTGRPASPRQSAEDMHLLGHDALSTHIPIRLTLGFAAETVLQHV